ncbi:unnamed protein product, partial [Tetraodon nigroviridis]
MGFGDLKSASGLKVLNDFLSDRSYIEGYFKFSPQLHMSGLQRSWSGRIQRRPPMIVVGYQSLAHLWLLSPRRTCKSAKCHLKRLYCQTENLKGGVPSQADVVVFDVLSSPPPADMIHALRWYNHIKSFQKSSLPGVKKPLGQYGPPGVSDTTSASKPAAKDDDDDDIDLFGSDDEEDEEAARIKEERLAQYAAKKAKKPTVIAKSSILLDVKPWDDETDMAKLEECVRSIQMDGLVWGQSKLVPVGYGIKKLQIGCVVEDDKVGTEILEEQITAFEDYVQSMDVAAFNKI